MKKGESRYWQVSNGDDPKTIIKVEEHSVVYIGTAFIKVMKKCSEVKFIIYSMLWSTQTSMFRKPQVWNNIPSIYYFGLASHLYKDIAYI